MDPMFRPSIIITLGKAGELIREHLSPYPNPTMKKSGEYRRETKKPVSVYHLLAGVDSSLHNSIALLHVVPEVVKDGDEVIKVDGRLNIRLRAIPIPLNKEFPNDPYIPQEPGDFQPVFLDTLRSVQLRSRIKDIRNKKYHIPDTRTQIFIAGEEDTFAMPMMAEVLKIIREFATVPSYRFEPIVCYLLNCNKVSKDYSEDLKKPRARPGYSWSDYYLTNFNFLFEPVIGEDSQVVFLAEDEMQYASAQTLLGFVATGMSSPEPLKTILRLNPHQIDKYNDHVGGMSTSMIQFPRQPALRYCSASMVREMMEEWRASFVSSDVTDQERYALRNRARNVAGDMIIWMDDGEERPGAEESFWPSLEILRRGNHPVSDGELVKQREAYMRLRTLTGQLFSSFSEDDIREVFANLAEKSWQELTDGCSYKAMRVMPEWANQTREAWQGATARLDAEIDRVVGDLCAEDRNCWDSARIFVDELGDRLVNVKDWIENKKQSHLKAHHLRLSEFEGISQGDWTSPENLSTIIDNDLPDAELLRPTMTGLPPAMNGSGGSLRMPPADERIATNLARKVAFKQILVPTVASLFTSTFLGFLSAALMVAPFNLSSPLQASIDGALALVLLVSNLFLYFHRSRRLEESRREMLDFHKGYFIQLCERIEDMHRLLLFHSINKNAEKMREHLDNFAEKCQARADGAKQLSEQVNEQLFKGPAGRCDVFVADGERLEDTGSNTLATVAQRVSYNRVHNNYRAGLEWHRSLSGIKKQLILRLRSLKMNLLTMDEAALQEYLYEFTAEIAGGYMVGKLVNIGAALDKPEIWNEVLSQVDESMYFAGVGLLKPKHYFVLGRDADFQKGKPYLPPDTIHVGTNREEWFMVLAFYSGGEPTKLAVNQIFPTKK